MLRILRQRNFGLLWAAGLISLIGDWVLVVGLPIEVYTRTGSTLATMGMTLAFLIPAITLGSVAGVLVDRWDRRRLMIVVNVGLAVTLLPLLAIDALGIWVAYAVLLAASSLAQLFEPAEAALLPNLLEGGDERDLVTANALNGLNNSLARIIGPVVGGVAVAAGGLTLVALVDAVTFLVAALLLLAIRTTRGRATASVPSPPAVAHEPVSMLREAAAIEHEAISAWSRLRREWREGLDLVLHHPILRALLVFMVITRVGEGLVSTLFVPWATDVLDTDAAGYGWILSAQAIGGLGGALVVGRFGSRIAPLRLLAVAAVTFGAIDLVLFTYPAFYPVLAPALVGMVIVGVPGAAIGAAFATLQQTHAADSHRGRVVGAMLAVGAVGSLVGAVAAGFLGQVVPVVPLLIVQGSGYVIAGLAVAWLTRDRVAREGGPPPERA
jgi:predicted MFS family arabinose efflux permease